MQDALPHGCPRCERPLLRTPTAHGLAYRCSRCGGRAVMMPVIRRALGPAGAAAAWEEALLAPASSALGCPMCARPMARAVLDGPAAGLDFDVCRSCQLAWLDAEELPETPAEAATSDDGSRQLEDAELPDPARATLLLWALRHESRARNALAGGWRGTRGLLWIPAAVLLALVVRALVEMLAD